MTFKEFMSEISKVMSFQLKLIAENYYFLFYFLAKKLKKKLQKKKSEIAVRVVFLSIEN